VTAAPGDDVVRRFLEAMPAHDWTTLAGCVAHEVERIGPYGDTYRGRDDYIAFLSALLPTLPGYAMDITRVVYDESGLVAVAELSETVTVDGAPLVTPESLVFDLTPDGLITHIAIYTQKLP
jgi:predicted ester cyclase